MPINLKLILLAFVLSAACSATQNISDSTENQTGSSIVRDGSSVEKAIIAKSISYEYEWIRKNYPNSQVKQQALVNKGKKHYDVITIATSSGEVKEIYFDINSFFGKGF